MDVNKLIHAAKTGIKNTKKEQDLLYEHHVMKKILNKNSLEEISQGYIDFVDQLKGFHAHGFEQTIDSLLKEDADILDKFTTKFQSIPEYIKKRDLWVKRTAEIGKSDDTPESKQMQVHAIDTIRTQQHNRVIDLFNSLNEYAEENGLLTPYPTNYHIYHKPETAEDIQEFHRFDMSNTNHRKDVSNILTNHMTVLEWVNTIVKEKYKETGRTQTTEEKLRDKTIGELAEIARKSFDKRQSHLELKDSVQELSDIESITLSR